MNSSKRGEFSGFTAGIHYAFQDHFKGTFWILEKSEPSRPSSFLLTGTLSCAKASWTPWLGNHSKRWSPIPLFWY